jgi:hypothetical protein
MKKFISTLLGRGLVPRFQPQSLALALGLSLLATGGGRTLADDSRPFPADVQKLQTRLSSDHIATLMYAINANNLFYFPVTSLNLAGWVRSGGPLDPFADTAGNLRFPIGQSAGALCVTFRDFLKNVDLQNEILNNLRTNPLIVGSAAGIVPRAAAVDPVRTARLVLSDPAAGNRRQVLAESLLTDSDSTFDPKASFYLGADALAVLRRVGNARYLSVEIEQPYGAQFRTNDVQINLSITADSFARALRSVGSSVGTGPRPTLLLSPRLPLALPPGGVVQRDAEFTSRISRAVRLQVYTREGSSVDPELVQRLIQTALDQAALQLQIDAAERQRTIATVLLEDGLSITLPLARLSEVAASMRTDSQEQWSTAFTRVIQRQGEVIVDTDATMVIGIFGGDFNTDVITRWNNKDYVNDRRNFFARQIEEMAGRITGDIPVVTGLRFTDSGSVTNVNVFELENVIGRFTTGIASLLNTRGMMEYVDQLTNALPVEALRVQRTEVGITNVGPSINWPGRTGLVQFIEIPVRFAKPVSSGISGGFFIGEFQAAPAHVAPQASNHRAWTPWAQRFA